MTRRPGPSVRLKLTLSYAGFLMVAAALLLAAVWVFLLRGTPGGRVFSDPADFLRALDPSNFGPVVFGPAAAAVLAFLLVFGLVGGWFLAGRMLAPLTRITEATRIATDGSLDHRIRLPGRRDEFRDLADAFDTMLARLEAHVAEQQRFAANASHELRTPSRSRRRCSTWPVPIRTTTPASSSTACAWSIPGRSTSPRRCSCSAGPAGGPSPASPSTCRCWPRTPPRRSCRSPTSAASRSTSGARSRPPPDRTRSCCS